MYINKPSVTKIEAADRVNFLHSTSYRFEQYEVQKPSSSINPIQARLFLLFKVQGGVFRDPLMISGTIKASPMKLCTVIVLLKAYQNTKRNFRKYDL